MSTPVTYPLGAPDAVIVYTLTSPLSRPGERKVFQERDVVESFVRTSSLADKYKVETWVAAFRSCVHCNDHGCWHFLRKVCDGIQDSEAPLP